ncbi:sugar phosphate isomerase/epimerase family protein [Mesorhizobium sp. PL10]
MVKAAGYDALAINCDGIPSPATPHITPENSISESVTLIDSVRKAGLSVPALSTNFFFFANDADDDARGIRHVKAMIDRAAAAEVEYVHLCSPYLPAAKSDDVFADFVDILRTILLHAKAKGVAVGLESPAPFLYPRILDYQRIIDALGDLDLMMNYDPSHFAAHGEDPVAAVRAFADRIRHVHIKDAAGLYPNFTFPPLGKGVVNFKEVLSALKDARYDGALTIEYEANDFGWNIGEAEVLTSSRAFLSDLGI